MGDVGREAEEVRGGEGVQREGCGQSERSCGCLGASRVSSGCCFWRAWLKLRPLQRQRVVLLEHLDPTMPKGPVVSLSEVLGQVVARISLVNSTRPAEAARP